MSATLTPASAAHPHARNIRRTRLPNGLLVLTESIPHVRSVSMGVWIDSGSRDEPLALNGLSHFVEHMVFKGTTSRSAQQFAREVDSIGGNLDAFTGKESICFNIKVLDENVAPALDLLSDLVLHPTFTPEDIAREQGVILEEIKMDEDNPDYLVHETFTQNFWKGHSLGRPILGTVKTVSSFNQQIVFDYYAGRFTPRKWSSPPPAISTTTPSSPRSPSTSARSPPPAKPRSPTPRPRHQPPHHPQAQKIPRAGPALPRRPRAAGRFARPLRRLPAQHHARRRHELAPLPDHPRRPRPRLLHLLRDQPLPRHRVSRHLRRHLRRKNRRSPAAYPRRTPPPQRRHPSPRQS